MQERNVSDLIENYLKSILNNRSQVEIKRSELARRFSCVPSQINYVIKTRFTLPRGYKIESKRGGGGYIRIAKVSLVENTGIFDTLIEYIGKQISEKSALQIIQSLFEQQILTKREANLILVTLDRATLSLGNKALEDTLRARILVEVLNQLRFAD